MSLSRMLGLLLLILGVFLPCVAWSSEAAPPPKQASAQGATSTAGTGSDLSKYGFESEDELWDAQTFKNSQAVTSVGLSEKGIAKFGVYSMKMAVHLVGSHPQRSNGEAVVDMRYSPPKGVKTPINLEGRLITAWVKVPANMAGPESRPNGVELLVKDQNWKSEYGTWFNLTDCTDPWTSVTLTPSKRRPPNGFMDKGFDPTRIVSIGVKIGTGDGSTEEYKGFVYVDGVNW
jgi:hypothetical protein